MLFYEDLVRKIEEEKIENIGSEDIMKVGNHIWLKFR